MNRMNFKELIESAIPLSKKEKLQIQVKIIMIIHQLKLLKNY